VVLNESTGVSRKVVTDSIGRYSAPSLSVGKHRVAAGKEGFQSGIRSGIELTIAGAAVVDLKLSVGAATQSLEVARHFF
jgi:hypothetical protein